MSQNLKRSSLTRFDRYHTALLKKPSSYHQLSGKLGVSPDNKARIMHAQSNLWTVRNTKKRTSFATPEIEPLPKNCISILITGGIGDFIAVESFMNNRERNEVKTLFLATRSHKGISDLIEAAPIFPNLQEVVVLHDTWDKFFCFMSKEDLAIKNSEYNLGIPEDKIKFPMADLSIAKVFIHVDQEMRSFNGSSLLNHTLADISHIDLPESFIACCPYSPNDRRMERDFSPKHWEWLISRIESENKTAVVLNVGNDPVPPHPKIVDLSNVTTLPESIEVLKKASGFVSIDSCLSTVATKLMNVENLLIFSKNPHLHSWKHVYYAPQKKFPFILETLNDTKLPVTKPNE